VTLRMEFDSDLAEAPNRRELANRVCADIYRHIFEIAKNISDEADQRLPTERRLIAQFQTSRGTVRKALARLEADGIIRRQVGSGTYLGPNSPVKKELEIHRIPEDEVSPLDVLEARLALQPGLAEFIVLRATAEDFRNMEALLERARRASSQVQFRQAMYEFHMCAVRSTRNALLVWLFRAVVEARDRAGWEKMNYINRSKADRAKIISANTKLLQILRNRNIAGARAHLDRFFRSMIADVASFDPE
jgi:DNA-binding FadR family transcriptional regulator